MASPFLTQSLMTEIGDRVKTAWGGNVDVYYGFSRVPYKTDNSIKANIIFSGASLIFSRNNSIRYNYSFEIIGRFRYPAQDTDYLEFEKAARLNELHDAMITGTQFASLGDIHNITAVSHEDLADDSDYLYSVTASFEVQCEQPRV